MMLCRHSGMIAPKPMRVKSLGHVGLEGLLSNAFVKPEAIREKIFGQGCRGREPWLIAFQRTDAQGPFRRDDMNRLAPLAQAFTEVADLSDTVGRTHLVGVLDGLHLVQRPAIALGRDGLVLGMNHDAEAIFDADLRVSNARLFIRDGKAREWLERMTSGIARAGDSGPLKNIIVARRETKKPIQLKLLPVHGAARSPFLGARFILTLTDLEATGASSIQFVSEAFSLTPAEAKVASLIATGLSPEEIATKLKVSRETVRNQLKAAFVQRVSENNRLAAMG
ncbi:DNA-binding CsgD family transcriptional regulator [Bradyrhizobium embrapense]